MSKESRTVPAAFRGYLLPYCAHDSLIDTRDQLRLLSEFTQARSDTPEALLLRPDVLSELFARVATHLDEALSLVVRHGPDPA